MKVHFSLVFVLVSLGAPVFSGVVTWTKQGIQYLSNEQFAALQDPYGTAQTAGTPQTQGLWRDDPNSAAHPPPGSGSAEEAPPPVYDDDEDDDDENDVDDVEEEKEGNDEEVEDEEERDEAEPLDDEVPVEAESDESKQTSLGGSKYKIKSKKVTQKSAKAVVPKKKKKKPEIVEEKSDEVEGDDEVSDDSKEAEQPPQPPMPPTLKQELMMSQYDAAVNGVQDPNAPLFSRMTSYLTSLLGRGGLTLGSDPVFLNRHAKSIDQESTKPKDEVIEKILSRRRRQIHLRDVQLSPFYHVRSNIRSSVRQQPISKPSTRLPISSSDDSLSLTSSSKKPIKLLMEPTSGLTTYQNPPLNPATTGLRGPGGAPSPSSGGSAGGVPGGGVPSSSGGSNNGGTPTRGGGNKKQNSSGGNKKNNNKNKESEEEEDDSDESGNERDYPNYGEEDEESNAINSDEDNSNSAGEEEDDEYDEDYED